MALSTAKYEKFYETSGGGADEVSTKDLADITANWAVDKAEGCKTLLSHPFLGPLVYQLQQMQDELDYLRTEISANKDKTGITTSQANAITANTAKTSMTLGTTGSTALAGDTRIAAFTADDTSIKDTTKSTAITFGNFTTTGVGKTATYTLPITVTETTVVVGAKGSTTTTLTKTGSITLT